MTPTRSSCSPRRSVWISFLAACDSSVIFERFSEICDSWRARRGGSRQDLQPHERAFRPADQLHDVVEAPADDVGQRARFALADGGDAVADLDVGRGRRGAARQYVHDRDVVVDELQRGADALVREAHRDVVFLGVARRQVVGVRVVDVRVRVHERLEHVVRGDLLDALCDALVALAQDVARLGPGLAGEQQRQRVVLHALAPQLVQLVDRSRPAVVRAVEAE